MEEDLKHLLKAAGESWGSRTDLLCHKELIKLLHQSFPVFLSLSVSLSDVTPQLPSPLSVESFCLITDTLLGLSVTLVSSAQPALKLLSVSTPSTVALSESLCHSRHECEGKCACVLSTACNWKSVIKCVSTSMYLCSGVEFWCRKVWGLA